ncbi:MAG: hypothetical protein AAF723_06730 [Pseudomonadota bacterium]
MFIALPIALFTLQTAAFTTDEAARCAATYAFTLDAMQSATRVPETIYLGMKEGLAIWEYELSASAPNASAAVLQAAADRAVAHVRNGLPEGEGRDNAEARGDYLTAQTKICAQKIDTLYGDTQHPVMVLLAANAAPIPDKVPPPPLAAQKAPSPPSQKMTIADQDKAKPAEKPKRQLR